MSRSFWEVANAIRGSTVGPILKRYVENARQERAAETDTGRSELYQCSGKARLRINEVRRHKLTKVNREEGTTMKSRRFQTRRKLLDKQSRLLV
jgi:hypothetical protein